MFLADLVGTKFQIVIADLINIHPASVARWLIFGLRMERDHPEFYNRIDTPARPISAEEADNAAIRHVAP